jgi:hypothetical protein
MVTYGQYLFSKLFWKASEWYSRNYDISIFSIYIFSEILGSIMDYLDSRIMYFIKLLYESVFYFKNKKLGIRRCPFEYLFGEIAYSCTIFDNEQIL